MRFQAVLFDLDGVLWHSSAVHARAFSQAFAEHEVQLPSSAYATVAGMRTEAAVAQLSAQYCPGYCSDQTLLRTIAKRKQAIAITLLRSDSTLDPEVSPALQLLHQAGYRIALATSASRATMHCFLDLLPPTTRFDSTVCGEDVVQGKPAPDIFLAAAQAVHVEPLNCIVVEDSQSGILAALHAGMHVVAYRSSSYIGIQHVIAHCETLNQVAGLLVNLRSNPEAAV